MTSFSLKSLVLKQFDQSETTWFCWFGIWTKYFVQSMIWKRLFICVGLQQFSSLKLSLFFFFNYLVHKLVSSWWMRHKDHTCQKSTRKQKPTGFWVSRTPRSNPLEASKRDMCGFPKLTSDSIQPHPSTQWHPSTGTKAWGQVATSRCGSHTRGIGVVAAAAATWKWGRLPYSWVGSRSLQLWSLRFSSTPSLL